MRQTKPWKVQEAEYVRAHYPTTSLEDLSRKLNRTTGSIREYANKILKVKKSIRSNSWTKEEDHILLNNPTVKRDKLANQLPNRTLIAISARRKMLQKLHTCLS